MRSDRYKDEQLNTENEAVQEEVQSEDLEEPKGRLGRRTRKDKPHKDDAASIEHDLTRLKKKDLLEIMLAQGKEIDALRERVADLEAQLANREFEFEKIGSIAEASLAVTNIFKEAEEAARIYLDNIRRGYEKRSKQHSDD